MGRGVIWRGAETIPVDVDLLAYCDLQNSTRADKVKKRRRDNSSYLIETDLNGEPWILDGTNSRRVGPQINHSQVEANLFMRKDIFENRVVIVLRTCKEINFGDQLFYGYFRGAEPSEEESHYFPFL